MPGHDRPLTRPPLTDLFNYELVQALGQSGCTLCSAIAKDEERWLRSFWREGRQDAATRRAFFDAGGFCPEHAQFLLRISADEGTGAVIADLYGALAAADHAWLGRTRERLGSRRGRSRLLARRRRCAACVARAQGAERKAHFFVEALGEAAIRDAYLRSDGLCFEHLSAATAEAIGTGELDAADFLLADWQRRLTEVAARLAEYERKRDYRYAAEPKGREQASWTDVIRLYAGRRRA